MKWPLLFVVVVGIGLAGCAAKETPSLSSSAVAYLSDGKGPFERVTVSTDSAPPEISVSLDRAHQTIEGFGGAFNEKGWQALSTLSAQQRDAVLGALFDPQAGIALNLCRVPIGASDYALDRYTEDESPGDWEMSHFSIERDQKMLIPFIEAAMKLQPKLRLWASAWTPPTWMKNNRSFDSGSFLDDPRVYKAYALYLVKFLQAYRAAGLPLEAVAVQNEPLVQTNYPSCLWTPEQYRTFVRDYMGPAFKEAGLDGAVMLGTFNEGDEFPHAQLVLNDPVARGYVSIIGLQWYAITLKRDLQNVAPTVRFWQTETDCGNWPWRPGFNPDRPPNDFDYGAYTWRMMRDYLEAGVTAYDMWNMVLDETGKSIDVVRPWPQNSAVVVDTQAKSVTYTPMYYAFGSFSKFVPPGSRRLGTRGTYDNAVAFATPSGSTVVVLMNEGSRAKAIGVRVGAKSYRVEMKPSSFATLVVG